MLRSFGTADTERVWNRLRVAKLSSELQRAAYRELLILDAADVLQDLRVPRGNRSELLKGDRPGQHSIRVNEQWRLCSIWTDTGPVDVELVDYH